MNFLKTRVFTLLISLVCCSTAFVTSAHADYWWSQRNTYYGTLFGPIGSDPYSVCAAAAATRDPDRDGAVLKEVSVSTGSARCRFSYPWQAGTAGYSIDTYLTKGGGCTSDQVDADGTCLPQTGDQCPAAGNPIQIASGNKFQREDDYQGAGAYPLTFSRFYNSQNSQWRHTYSRSLKPATATLNGEAVETVMDVTFGGYQLRVPARLNYTADDGHLSVGYLPQVPGTPDWDLTIIDNGDGTGSVVYPVIAGKSSYVLKAQLDIVPYSTIDPGATYLDWYATMTGLTVTTSNDLVEAYNLEGQLLSLTRRDGQVQTLTHTNQGFTVSDQYGRQLSVEYGFDDPALYTSFLPIPLTLKSLTTPDGAVYAYQSAFIYTGTLPLDSPTQWAGNVGVVYPAGNGQPAYSRNYTYEQIAGKGYLKSIEDERGTEYVSWGYDPVGRGISSENPGGVNGSTLDFSIDGQTTVTNALGKDTVYHFDTIAGQNRVTLIEGVATQLCAGASQALSYDDRGYPESAVDWNNNLTNTTYDDAGLMLSETVAVGTPDERSTTYSWHPTLRVPLSVITPDTATTYSYDPNGNRLSETITDVITTETRSTTWTYNSVGQVLSVDGPRSDLPDTMSYSYYDCTTGFECGQLHTATNALGHVTTYTSYDAHGYPTAITDSNGVPTTLAYDNRQRITQFSISGVDTSIAYDPTGNLSRVTLDDGTYTDYTWDDANRLVAVSDAMGHRIEWTLDAAGNRTAEVIKDPVGTVQKSQDRVYDELSRLISQIPAHGGQTDYSYDTNSNLLTSTDPATRTDTRSYDALDRLVSLQDAIQGITSYAYDTQDNLVSVTDPENLTTTYTYNGFTDLLSTDSPDTGLSTYTVDAAGNRTSETDARGVTISYGYDALNRLISVSYPDSTLDIAYSYDQGVNGVGRLTGITDQSGSTSYTYDARGNITDVSQTINGQTYTQSYSYNGADRLLGMTLPSARALTYQYDPSGRVVEIGANSGAGSETLVSGITRLPYGPAVAMTLGNGVARTRSFDQDYRIETITDAGVLNRGYGFSSVDNITAITDGLNPALSQLFTYDSLDRLDFATGNYGDKTYGYDGVGNRLSLNTDLTGQGGSSETQNYTYASGSHRLTDIVGERSFQYDAAGNTLANGPATFSYNDRNRMASATANGVTTNYGHNALGQRVQKTSGSDETHYIYDLSGRLIAEADGSTGAVQVEYSYLDGEPLTLWRDDAAPSVPGDVTLLSPSDSVSTASPTYEWEDEGNTETYRLQVYDRSIAQWVFLENYAATDICAAGICSVTPSLTLGFSVNHRWRIRARNAVGWNSWTSSELFDYVDSPPGEITPLSPLVSTDTATPAYTWEDPGNVTDFRLLVYDRFLKTQVHNEIHTASDICSAGVCSVVPAGVSLNFNTNHFWRIRAKNSGGWNTWSGQHRFDYVDDIPGSITPISPLVSTDTATPVYTWDDLGNVTDYRLLVYDRHLKTQVHNEIHAASDICTGGTCTVMPAGVTLNYSTNHFWRIRAKNSGGWNDWSGQHKFDYADDPPGDVTPLLPMTTVDTTTPTYEWTGVGNAVKYQVVIYDRVLTSVIHSTQYQAADICTNTDCVVTPSDALSIGANHFWRVRANNSGGWGPWSANTPFDVTSGGQ